MPTADVCSSPAAATGLPSLFDMVAHHARTMPEQPALSFRGRTTSWRELSDWVGSTACQLLARVRPGGRVAYLGQNSDQNLVASLAAAQAGLTFLGLNWRLAEDELAYILADGDPHAVIVDAPYLPVAERLCARLDGTPHWFIVGGEAHGYEPFDRRWPSHKTRPRIEGADSLWQIYTSGTTGRPKGVQLSCSGVETTFRLRDATGWPWLQARPCRPWLIWLPMFHLGGLLTSWGVLRGGGHCIIFDGYDVDVLLDAAEEHRIEVLQGVPTMVHDILDALASRPRDLSELRYIVYGAAPISRSTLLRAEGALSCELVQSYGSTETGGLISCLSPEDHRTADLQRLQSAGRACPGVDVAIVREDWSPASPGEIGEIAVRSAAIMTGYWRRPEADLLSLRDGWVRTGDLGRIDEDGYVHILDRASDMIVSGGENIYPKEVEDTLGMHPGVLEAAVIGIPDERWGQVVAAAVILGDEGLSETDLIAFLRSSLAGYKIPRFFRFVSAIPKNATGKVLRREVRCAIFGLGK